MTRLRLRRRKQEVAVAPDEARDSVRLRTLAQMVHQKVDAARQAVEALEQSAGKGHANGTG